jgi:hypothetical protein
LPLKIQAHRDVIRLEAYEQLFGERNVFRIGSRVPLTCYGFNKRWRNR